METIKHTLLTILRGPLEFFLVVLLAAAVGLVYLLINALFDKKEIEGQIKEEYNKARKRKTS